MCLSLETGEKNSVQVTYSVCLGYIYLSVLLTVDAFVVCVHVISPIRHKLFIISQTVLDDGDDLSAHHPV